jgi:hypothetical protein
VSLILSFTLTCLDKNNILKKTLAYHVVCTLQICNVFIVHARDEASQFLFHFHSENVKVRQQNLFWDAFACAVFNAKSHSVITHLNISTKRKIGDWCIFRAKMHCKMEWVNEPLMYLLLPEHTGSCLSLSILANL